MTNIIVTFQVEGFHNWPDAETLCPDMGFLSAKHRHMFHIVCKKKVEHDDRQIEIIQFKNMIQKYLYSSYGNACMFGSKSCESIATELFDTFALSYCSVLEDGENGAEITK